MKKKTVVLAAEDDLLMDLTFHDVPASLLAEFAEKIVRPYYRGDMNAAIQDPIHKALAEKEFVLSHITQIRDRNLNAFYYVRRHSNCYPYCRFNNFFHYGYMLGSLCNLYSVLQCASLF
jgi:hypothetical protein